MSTTIVMTLGQGKTLQLENQLAAYQKPSKNPYIRFFANYDSCSISLYTSGKIVFQGQGALELAKRFGYQATEEENSDSSLNQNFPLIGTDEVGNGSYFGGLAVVASFVTPQDHQQLKQLGVDDSKRLTDKQIQHIAPKLQDMIPHKALLLNPSKYNELVGSNKPYNAVSVKVALHNQAIFLLLKQGYRPDRIVIDAFTSPSNYQKYLKHEKNPVKNQLSLEEKAESKYLAVAVSSIIARALFLKNLDDLGASVGYRLPSGAGQASDHVASEILQNKGMASLKQVAKLHFANTQKALRLSQTS